MAEVVIEPKIVTTTPIKESSDKYLMGQSFSGFQNSGFQNATPIQTSQASAQFIQKRNLQKILQEALIEAELAGEEFYYAFPVKGGVIEGPSIGMMVSLMRIWGNLEVETDVEETKDGWIFKVTIKDLETNLKFNTVYRHKKPQKPVGSFAPERWEEMQFQAAQSKALRNALTRVIPRWLQSACLEKAKKAIAKVLQNPEKAKKQIIESFARFKITKEDLENILGIEIKDWSINDLIYLKGILNQLVEGVLKPSDLKSNSSNSEFAEANGSPLSATHSSSLADSSSPESSTDQREQNQKLFK